MKMNQEVKAAWVSALRSGEYEQGIAALRSGNKFCCLGVLCDIAIKQFDLDVEVEHKEGCSDPTCCNSFEYDGEGSFLPPSVQDWAEMPDKIGKLETPVDFSGATGGRLFSLYAANDAGLTFEQIADIIEEQF